MTATLKTHLTSPKTPKRPVETVQLGVTRIDDYAWMKDDNWQEMMADPSTLKADIRAHLETENTYSAGIMEDLAPLKNAIFEEMKGRLKSDASGVPSPDGAFAYNHRFRSGDQHGLYERVAIDPSTKTPAGEPQTILDAEALSKNHPAYFDLGGVAHSDDQNWLAYSVDVTGAENYEIFVKTMDGEARSTGVTKSAGGLQWAKDNAAIFWVERDENQRPYAVFAKNIHDAADSPRLIYKETDPGFFVSVAETDSGNFIQINSHNHTTSEIWVIPADAPHTAPSCVSPRQAGLEYSLHDQGGYFYILTNANDATDFAIMRAPIGHTAFDNWEDYIPHASGTLIIGIETYEHFLVRLIRENALPRIIIRDMRDGSEHDIAFDEDAYGLGLMGGYEYSTPWMRFAYSSPTTPRQTFDYNMDTRERRLRQTQEVPSGHEPSDYKCERILVTARDGAEVPVTLLYKSGLTKDGSAPLLLYGYGSYGITIPAGFRTSILSLVDRGFVYAIAHIRGGMSKGYQWYLDGKLEKKENTFNDFIDVGRSLCGDGYSARGRVVAHGGSAGGLLVGAALNQDPSLFGGVIAAVPFVDVLNTMSDDTLPLTPPEWPEWGNPLTDEQAYNNIAAYSPYDNVAKTEYPPTLITGGLTDPRVTYWEPAKWAAKLRDNQTGPAPILLKINMEAGHQGESGRYDSLKETALEFAFAVAVAG
ncbi:MAG: S9 family peptidase [Hellea sp.]